MKGGVMESQQGSGGISSSQASETVAGIAELATQAEVDNEADDVRIVTPLKLSKIKRRMTTNSFLIGNLTLVTSRTDNSETIAVKTQAGTDPSASDPAYLAFQDGTGGFSVLSITAALSLTLSSGSTLGAVNNEPFRIWIVAFNDAGTLRLGVIKCYTGTAIVGLEDNGVASSTAEGGAGAAGSAGVFYTGTAVTSKVYRILGRLDYTLTTAGTWVTAPTIKLFSQGSKLPGDVVKFTMTENGTFDAGGTTTIPGDNSIPQNTEGVAFTGMDATIAPSASANLLRCALNVNWGNSTTDGVVGALFRDAGANCVASCAWIAESTNRIGRAGFLHKELALSTTSTTFKLRMGSTNAGTVRLNALSDSAGLGGTFASTLLIEEIMV